MKRDMQLLALVLTMCAMWPIAANALACCPSGGHGTQLATAAVATGLGSSQPVATDASLSPYWHAYAFPSGGVITYVQINDQAGTVHAAVGVANGQLLVLPMGTDPVRQVVDVGAAQVVYKSAQVTVAASVGADGAVTWLVQTTGL